MGLPDPPGAAFLGRMNLWLVSAPSRLAVVSLIAMAGCAQQPRVPESRDGEVIYSQVTPDHAEHLKLERNQVYQVGTIRPDDRVLPIYPPAMLERQLPLVAVCVELYVDERGVVYETHALEQGEACPALAPAVAEAFHPAAVDAVRRWRFEPSYVCERRPGWSAGNCEGEGRERQAVPVSLAYRFVFRQVAGKPVVEMGAAR
jgi:hypothetical protein